ncbi:MAG TPA: hypothetical protein PLW31_03175 [Bacteroidales bacterium]|nr:hypothetical protein [Bacteroidales bacterium]
MINFGIKKDSTHDLLRQDVKSVINYEDDKKVAQSFYDEIGNRILKYYFNEDDSIRLKQETTFQGGLKTGYINYDKYDNRTSFGQYIYDHSSKTFSKYHNNELEEEYHYDHLGRIIEVFYPNTGAKEFYEYDSSNLAISQLSIPGKISLFGSSNARPNKKLTIFENDQFGNIVRMKVLDAESKQILFIQNNKINLQGDEIESIGLNGDGSVYSKIYYDYKYDEKNNWILKRTYDKNGNVVNEEKRQILYYTENDFNINKSDIISYQAPLELPFKIDDIRFLSDDHIRYQNGQIAVTSSSDNQGHNKGANRGIQIEPNISGGEGYTITIFNIDGNHPLWGNNVQMAPKQMKLVSVDNHKIVLHGYGQDAMGGSFSDYGLTIFHNGNEPTKLKLHIYDRKVEIEYFKSSKEVKKEPEIVKLAMQAAAIDKNENPYGSRSFLVQIYRSVKSDPKQLNDISDYESLGRAFLSMLDQNLSYDIDALQMMVSVGYLCISKAIEKDNQNILLYGDRLILLRVGHEPFKYTVMTALNLNAGGILSYHLGNSDLKARDAIYKMEIADIELNPVLYQQFDLFRERRNEFDQKIAREFFKPEMTKENVIKTGIEIHKKLLEYLENRVLNEGDVDF